MRGREGEMLSDSAQLEKPTDWTLTYNSGLNYLLTGVWPYTQPQSQASGWWSR